MIAGHRDRWLCDGVIRRGFDYLLFELLVTVRRKGSLSFVSQEFPSESRIADFVVDAFVECDTQ